METNIYIFYNTLIVNQDDWYDDTFWGQFMLYDRAKLFQKIWQVRNRDETSTAGIVTGLYIILGILHHLTVHHDESLVQVWVIDWELLPGIAAAEFVCVEEEGGEEDTGYVNREGDGKDVIIEKMLILKKKEIPD